LYPIVGLIVFVPRAAREKEAAANQQTSSGVITNCNHSGKGNSCHYIFPTDSGWYKGAAANANADAKYGDTTLVYYDSKDPRINSLQDFSEMSHRDKDVEYILLASLCAITAFFVYSLATAASSGQDSMSG
jgi:hypothetical protein